MYIQPYKHPLYRPTTRRNVRGRWFDPQTGQENQYHQLVLSLIQQGGGKHFLNYPFFRGQLPILRDDMDLRGFKIWQLDQDFGGHGDNFRGISFDHAEIWHSKFKNTVFSNCSFDFAEFYGCTFESCAFVFTNFVGAEFEKCNFIKCDFAEPCSWENGTFVNCQFDGCFLGRTTPFNECYFDDRTQVVNMAPHSFHFGTKVNTPSSALSGFYSSFQAAYEAAGAEELAMEFLWKGMQAFSRHNQVGVKRSFSIANEWLTGYGLRPLRPLLALLLVYVFATFGFATQMSLKESMVFTAGGLFTFGAGAEHLKNFGYGGRILYVMLAFSGISATALFITCLANVWFRRKIPTPTVRTPYNS